MPRIEHPTPIRGIVLIEHTPKKYGEYAYVYVVARGYQLDPGYIRSGRGGSNVRLRKRVKHAT